MSITAKRSVEKDLNKTISAILGVDDVFVNFDSQKKFNFFTWSCDLVLFDKFLICDIAVNNDNLSTIDIANYRSIIDVCICYYLFCDIINYKKQIINSENEYLHNQLEKIRVILLGSQTYRGFALNIAQKIIADFESANEYDMLSIILFDNYFSQIFPTDIKNIINHAKNKYSNKIINLITGLLKFINNQHDFFVEVKKIISLLSKKDTKDNSNNNKNNHKPEDTKNNLDQKNNIKTKQDYLEEIEDFNKKFQDNQLANQDQFDSINSGKNNKSLISKNIQPSIKVRNDNQNIEFVNSYKIFTTRFDEILYPQKFLKKEELIRLEKQLNDKFNDLRQISKNIKIKLKKKLLSKKKEFMEIGSINGVINRKKLTQLIINPLVNNILVNKNMHNSNNVAVTILLDNSGSMRGKPIIMSALSCYILAQIFEEFSIRTEIIGYTTKEWKGGSAKKMWDEMGKVKNPGRLNELRHIIYKDFKQSFKIAKSNLALMLKEGILKENIDGEAILFAIKRLNNRSENRKILLVISDGNPIDDATNEANEENLLINHLQNIVRKIDKRKDIELASIAIGYTNDNIYKNSISVKDINEIGDAMIERILQFF